MTTENSNKGHKYAPVPRDDPAEKKAHIAIPIYEGDGDQSFPRTVRLRFLPPPPSLINSQRRRFRWVRLLKLLVLALALWLAASVLTRLLMGGTGSGFIGVNDLDRQEIGIFVDGDSAGAAPSTWCFGFDEVPESVASDEPDAPSTSPKDQNRSSRFIKTNLPLEKTDRTTRRRCL